MSHIYPPYIKDIQSPNCSLATLNPPPSLCLVPGRGREADSLNLSSGFLGRSLHAAYTVYTAPGIQTQDPTPYTKDASQIWSVHGSEILDRHRSTHFTSLGRLNGQKNSEEEGRRNQNRGSRVNRINFAAAHSPPPFGWGDGSDAECCTSSSRVREKCFEVPPAAAADAAATRALDYRAKSSARRTTEGR